MLEKLLRSRSFGTIMGHLVRRQVTLPTSSRGLAFPLVVRRVTPAFLGCWVLIILALVFHFQHDDHSTLFDAMAHVETSTYPF
jgi:hypothetical protein